MLRKIYFKHYCIQGFQVKSRIADKNPELNGIEKLCDKMNYELIGIKTRNLSWSDYSFKEICEIVLNL
jgi:hypothetical protein